MQSILIFGASNGVGKILCKLCLGQGYRVHAMVRRQEAFDELTLLGVSVSRGDALNFDDVSKACLAVPEDTLVVTTLGGQGDKLNLGLSVNFHGQCNVVNAAEAAGLKRLIMVTSIGCGMSSTALPENIRNSIGRSLRDKSLAESWLQTSSLNYTIVRPGGLLNGESSLKSELVEDGLIQGLVNRADVALQLLNLIIDNSMTSKIYSCIEPNLRWQPS